MEVAAARLSRRVWHTPLVQSPWLSKSTGADVWLKLETVQLTGSFKIRGALNALARLRDLGTSATTVVTASAGNHGLALATAASALGMSARVHLPASAPAVKKEALAGLGAEIVEATSYDAAEAAAQEDVARTSSTFISAYSHPDVIAGAGTAALEMITDDPNLDVLVTPLGGGGLLAGTAIVARARLRDAVVIGAEAEASPVFTTALAAGRPVTVNVRETLADGLAGNMEHDSQTFGIVRDLVDHVVRVPEKAIAGAMRELMTRDRLIAEGAAATAVAALLLGDLPMKGRRVGVILSGRNVDASVLDTIWSSRA